MPSPYLRSCPFCGSPEVSYAIQWHPNHGEYLQGWVSCDHCEADGPNVLRDGRKETSWEEVAEAWNTRWTKKANVYEPKGKD